MISIEELYSLYRDCGYKITTDSRKISGGEMFFALKGENFNGNDYAVKALKEGASYAVVDDCEICSDSRLIKVEDAMETLKELSVYHRLHVHDGRLRVLGLTGTNGKTTTKNLIRSVLSSKYKVCATEGNFNNDIGVPLTLLSVRPDTQIAIVEMGANHPDDIYKLVRVCQPDCGLITNVGRAHLQGFGSFDGVKAAKGELYKWLGSKGNRSVIFLNEDDTDLKEMCSSISCHFWGYGAKYQSVTILPASDESPFLKFLLDGKEVRTNLVGNYNISNVLAAMAVGDYFGVKREDAVKAIEAYIPSNTRSQLVRTVKNHIVADAYNANPSSMAAAIENFAAINSSRKKVALLGDMKELGERSSDEHLGILKLLADNGIEAFLAGEEFQKAVALLPKAESFAFHCFPSSEKIKEYLASNPLDNALILLKGSHSTSMEKVMEVL